MDKDDFKKALAALFEREQTRKLANGFKMLKANYRSPGREISAERLAKAADDSYTFSTANEQYGSFAHKICDVLDYDPGIREDGSTRWTFAICEASSNTDDRGHFQWLLRPEVATAMEELGLVERVEFPDALEDIQLKASELAKMPDKDRDAISKARIGQGMFREKLINHWKGCSITGCEMTDILIASHIKPWRDCEQHEAIDMVNGLLLLPNLDAAFDKGFISFDNEGQILFSPQLRKEHAEILGLTPDMKLRRVYPYHHPYLEYHRQHVFRSTD